MKRSFDLFYRIVCFASLIFCFGVFSNAQQTSPDSDRADVSGAYTGTLKFPAKNLNGRATLTIEGNKFTLKPERGDARTGRITAVNSGDDYVAVAMMFDETGSTNPQPPRTVLSLRLRKSAKNFLLSTAPGESREFAFDAVPDGVRNQPEKFTRIQFGRLENSSNVDCADPSANCALNFGTIDEFPRSAPVPTTNSAKNPPSRRKSGKKLETAKGEKQVKEKINEPAPSKIKEAEKAAVNKPIPAAGENSEAELQTNKETNKETKVDEKIANVRRASEELRRAAEELKAARAELRLAETDKKPAPQPKSVKDNVSTKNVKTTRDKTRTSNKLAGKEEGTKAATTVGLKKSDADSADKPKSETAKSEAKPNSTPEAAKKAEKTTVTLTPEEKARRDYKAAKIAASKISEVPARTPKKDQSTKPKRPNLAKKSIKR
ncbi:MAG TPA: hypothetical protein VEX64_05660 [Pyrinomonadaceae bacterium]|nr:hypothetical protein [Pyrinomonadaceae bacterium]